MFKKIFAVLFCLSALMSAAVLSASAVTADEVKSTVYEITADTLCDGEHSDRAWMGAWVTDDKATGDVSAITPYSAFGTNTVWTSVENCWHNGAADFVKWDANKNAFYMVSTDGACAGVSFTCPYTGKVTLNLTAERENAGSGVVAVRVVKDVGPVDLANNCITIGNDQAAGTTGSITTTFEVVAGDVITIFLSNWGAAGGGAAGTNTFITPKIQYTDVTLPDDTTTGGDTTTPDTSDAVLAVAITAVAAAAAVVLTKKRG